MDLTYLNHNIEKKIFLFSCCIPIKGKIRGAIYDLQRDDIELVPNSMIDFIKLINKKSVKKIIDEWQNNEIAKEYLEFLIEKEFVFFSFDDNFPALSINCHNDDTSKIEFVTIVLSYLSLEKLKKISDRINYLGSKYLHFHIPFNISNQKLLNIFSFLQKSCITNLSISLPYQEGDLQNIIKEERLKSIYFYNSPYSKIVQKGKLIIHFSKSNEEDLFVPKASYDSISVNHRAYLIGKNTNLGLYKTIFIDSFEKIRLNAKEVKDYGVFLGSKEEIEKSITDLSKIWNIKRSEIVPCKRCEFRFGCTANFIPEYMPEKNTYFVNCNYNPNTNEWIN